MYLIKQYKLKKSIYKSYLQEFNRYFNTRSEVIEYLLADYEGDLSKFDDLCEDMVTEINYLDIIK